MDAHVKKLNALAVKAINLAAAQRRELLRLARGAIRHYLETETIPTYQTDDPDLGQQAGAFVTLWQPADATAVSIHPHGKLRGCIGHTQADQPLIQVVPTMAVKAATCDPRFPPMQLAELDNTAIEISILSPLTLITDLLQIEIGTHGLVIVSGWQRGLLLPQVPEPRGWGREEFLQAVYYKAGLPDGCWPAQADLFAFTTTVFDESEFT